MQVRERAKKTRVTPETAGNVNKTTEHYCCYLQQYQNMCWLSEKHTQEDIGFLLLFLFCFVSFLFFFGGGGGGGGESLLFHFISFFLLLLSFLTEMIL